MREAFATCPLSMACRLPITSLLDDDDLAAELTLALASTLVPKAKEGSSAIFLGCHTELDAVVATEELAVLLP